VSTVTVALPVHLRTLARLDDDVRLEVEGVPTLTAVLDALEARFPALRGTIREHATRKRRAYMRYFADGEDLSHENPDDPLPEAVATGREPLVVIGAIAGG
jgi:sulfur-carrier protein